MSEGCIYEVDPGDYFGMVSGSPEPPEFCENDAMPGSMYCEEHAEVL